MTKALLPITAFSRSLNITPRAIRFYEERGLVKSCRNQANQRAFDELAQARLALLVRFRSADLGLDVIGRLLDLYEREGDSAAFRNAATRALSAQATRLRDQLKTAERLASEFAPATATDRAA